MAYTEFYTQSGGNNANAGSTTNNTALYTSTNGNWNGTTIFTPTDSTNPVSAGVAVGMFASIFLDGATTAVFIARITAVTNATNGAITVSGTAQAGSPPSSLATGRTIKVGGAWVGPTGAIGFPFTLSPSIQALMDAANDPVRVNMKNTATYSITAGITAVGGLWVAQGYTSTVGDGGRATIDAGSTNATIFTAGANNIFADLIFSNNATGTTISGLSLTTGCVAYRCVVHDVRGSGIAVSNSSVVECEVYAFNKSNTANLPGIDFSVAGLQNSCYGNYIHDGTGSNCHGIRTLAGNNALLIIGNIIDTCAGSGISIASSSSSSALTHVIANNDFYNNGYGIRIENIGGNYWLIIKNNNFVKNTTAAFEGGTSFTRLYGYFFNNGYGAGTQANGSDYLHTGSMVLDDGTGNSTRVVYGSGLTPWNAPTTGDFRITLATAFGAGRGVFTQTDGTNTGTVAYPDIGAAQHQDASSGTPAAGGDVVFPVGYVGHAYSIVWTVANLAAVISVISGSLPPGITLTNPTAGIWQYSGTPTTVGTYNFTQQTQVGATIGTGTCHITINADPDEGVGGVGGS